MALKSKLTFLVTLILYNNNNIYHEHITGIISGLHTVFILKYYVKIHGFCINNFLINLYIYITLTHLCIPKLAKNKKLIIIYFHCENIV